MDPQATLDTILRDIAQYHRLYGTGATKEQLLTVLDDIEVNATWLRDRLATGGAAPRLTLCQAMAFGQFLELGSYGFENAKRLVREIVRLIDAAQPAPTSPLLAD